MLAAENNEVARAFTAAAEGFELVDERELSPAHDDTDGFYIARWRRALGEPTRSELRK